MTTVFLSHAIGAERLPFAAGRPPDSPERRRWRALSTLYRDSLAVSGFGVEDVLRPEIYQTELAREALGVAAGDWHLAVKPIEHLRPFHGIPNVFVCDWPHPALCAASAPGAPFLHHLRVLRHAGVVACCTERTTATLRAAGVDRAVTVPPFVPARGRVRKSVPTARRGPHARCVFLAAVDAAEGDRHAPLLRGFAQAQAQHGGLRLVAAVTGGDAGPLLSALGVADPDAAISFVQEDAFGQLQTSADFFLWDGWPGGLPLPLAQAALRGLPLVAVPSPGLELPPSSTVAVASTRTALSEAEEPAARVMELFWDQATAEGVRDAVLAAASLPDAARADMARCCQEEAERRYGLRAFQSGLRDLLDLLA